MGRIDEYVSTGAKALGVNVFEELAELKKQCAGRVSLLGNLNGIDMVNWTPVAQFGKERDGAESLVRRADEALCRAKAQGRNRVVVAPPG